MTCSNGTEYHDGTGDDFGCKIRSISFSAYCTPTRRPGPIEIEEREKRWHKDIPAYQALTKNGVQPRQVDGCDAVAKTDCTKFEIETGMTVKGKANKQRAKDTLELLGHGSMV